MKIKCPKKFLREWRTLSVTGVIVKKSVGKSSSFRCKLLWEEDDYPRINRLISVNISKEDAEYLTSFGISIKHAINDESICDIMEGSKEYLQVADRVRKFINETEEYGEKHYNNKDALWDKYFWSNDIYKILKKELG